MAGPSNPAGKRRPPWLARKDVASFLMQQDHYDRMLKAEGFRDIESGGDLNRLPASSIPPLGDMGDGEFWTAVSAAVAGLPPNYPKRAFLRAVAETGNLYGSARAHGITHHAGRWAFRKLLIRAGLGSSRMARSDV